MFNQLYIGTIAVLLIIIAGLGFMYNLEEIKTDKLKLELKNAKTETLQVKYLEQANAFTEKYETIKPIEIKEVHYEEINTSLGKHRIIIH